MDTGKSLEWTTELAPHDSHPLINLGELFQYSATVTTQTAENNRNQ